MSRENTFAFYLGCIMPNRYPAMELATEFLMDKLGYTLLEMERAACCPAPGVLRSFNKYDWMVAGARNLCIAEKLDADLLTVCNGCFGTLQEINLHLKQDEEARSEVNHRLKDLGDYEFQGTIEVRHIADVLASDVDEDDLTALLVRKVPARAAIHYGCHFLKPSPIREIDNPENPSLLENYVALLGVESVEFREKLTCCGAGGGVKAAHSDASMIMLGAKMRNIAEVKPDFIFDVCPFCHLQFETGQDYWNKNEHADFHIPVIHISQLTAFCMGLDEELVGMQYQIIASDYKIPYEEVTETE